MSYDPFERIFGGGFRRPGPRVVRPGPSVPRGGRIALIIGGVLVVLAIAFFAAIGLRVQYLFLDSLGHSEVFWTPIVARVLCFLIGLVLVGGIVGACVPAWSRALAAVDARGRAAGLLAGGALAAVAGISGGSWFASQWQTALLFIHHRDFGVQDPVFHQDLGFFVFDLPLYDAIQGLLWGGVIVALLATIAVGALAGVADTIPEELPIPLRPAPGRRAADGVRGAVRLAGILLAAVFVMAALGAHFGVYHLSTSQHDGFVGLDATQRDVVRPVLGGLQYVALVLAVGTVVLTVRTRRRAGPGVGAVLAGVLGGWLVLAGLLQVVPAAIYSGARVNPNAAQLQLPAISDYLTTSRIAWGLQPGRDVDTRRFGIPPGSPPTVPTVADLTADPGTLAGARIQDPAQVPEILQQIDRTRRSYQTYPRVAVDRYPNPDGSESTVIVGPREIEEANLPSQTFANQSFVFTHGAGITAVSVNQLDGAGNPLIVAGIDQNQSGPTERLSPGAPPTLAVADPRIYCGLQTTQPVVVNTADDAGHPAEFDGAGTDSYTRYGNVGGGIPVPGLLDRLALSIDQFKGLGLFLTSATSADSRILLHREVTDRVQQLAPFLSLDSDPYVVADQTSGHLVFIVDGYLKSDAVPEAFRMADGTSYMRNAVKAVVDARTCATTLYAVDPNEPLTAAWSSIFPGLLRPLTDMPVGLRAHLRYPQQLFSAQAEVFTQAHIDPSNPSNLFTKTDLYRVADESTANYVQLTLPGAKRPSFVLLQTFSPNASGTGQANNMVEWFAAECDYVTGNHPRLIAVPLAGGNVLGPRQFDNNINTDTTISQQLTLLGGNGSKTFLGGIVVLPFNERSFLYVRPFYVQAANGSFPQVRYVLVGTRDRVALGTNLGDALQRLFGQPVPGVPVSAAAPPPTVIPGTPTPSPSASPAPSGPPTSGLSLTPQETALLQDLLDRQAAEQRDLAAKDFDAYGRDQAAERRDLDQLQSLLRGGGASPAPGASPAATATPAASPSPGG